MLAGIVYEQGRYDEAMSLAEEADAVSAPDDMEPQIWLRGVRAKVLARREDSRRASANSRERPPSRSRPTGWGTRGWPGSTSARCSVWRGEGKRPRRLLGGPRSTSSGREASSCFNAHRQCARSSMPSRERPGEVWDQGAASPATDKGVHKRSRRVPRPTQPITWRTASSPSNRRPTTLSIRPQRSLCVDLDALTDMSGGADLEPPDRVPGELGELVEEQHAAVPGCETMTPMGRSTWSVVGGWRGWMAQATRTYPAGGLPRGCRKGLARAFSAGDASLGYLPWGLTMPSQLRQVKRVRRP